MNKSMRVALAGVSGALGTLFLIASVYFQPVQFAMLVFSAVVLFLPLAKRDYVGALLSYLVASVVSFFATGGQIIYLVGYWTFFGTHPIVLCFLKNKFDGVTKIGKYAITYAIKLVYFNICLVIVYFVLALVFDFASLPLPVWALFLVANPLFIVYDIFMLYFDKYVIGIVNRHILNLKPKEENIPKIDDDIFFGDEPKQKKPDNENSILNDDE